MSEMNPNPDGQRESLILHPMDDMRDGKDIHQWPEPLGQVISYVHASLYEVYAEYDIDSIKKQSYHKIFSFLAVFFGSSAMVLAIFQVFLGSLGFTIETEPVKMFELMAFFIALIAVGVALGSRWHKDWLKKRFLAEQCRSLKFRSLIHPYLWCASNKSWNDRFSLWKERFNTKVAKVIKADEVSLEEYLSGDEITTAPPGSPGCSVDVPYLEMLVDYYQKKRIITQIAYFKNRAHYFESINMRTGWIPDFCFIAGVVCAGALFGIGFFISENDPALHFFSSILLLLTLILPVFAIGARTMISSIEVSRSATLFHAKCIALENFNVRLSEELSRDTIQWVEIMKILWQCEYFFEIENREWLRIMNDAVWFL